MPTIYLVVPVGVIVEGAYTHPNSADLHRRTVRSTEVVELELLDVVPDSVRDDLASDDFAGDDWERGQDTPVMDPDDIITKPIRRVRLQTEPGIG